MSCETIWYCIILVYVILFDIWHCTKIWYSIILHIYCLIVSRYCIKLLYSVAYAHYTTPYIQIVIIKALLKSLNRQPYQFLYVSLYNQVLPRWMTMVTYDWFLLWLSTCSVTSANTKGILKTKYLHAIPVLLIKQLN